MATTPDIVAKLWALCNVLRDDGVTYNEYVTELTYLLFLKMLQETGKEDRLPKQYRWAELAKRDDMLAAMQARLETLEAQPAPGKAFLKAVALDKQHDVNHDSNIGKAAVDELPPNATPQQRAHHELKKVFATGGVPFMAR